MTQPDHATSATEPDWARERAERFWDPPRKLLGTIRGYQAARPSGMARKLWALRHRFWSVITQAEIHLGTQIGGGLRVPHPNGIVIHPQAVIGPNCTIMAQVTIGQSRGPGVPVIGGHVDIGAGARILGAVTIGDHAQIGANAVVTRDVPAGATAVGVPARIIPAGTP